MEDQGKSYKSNRGRVVRCDFFCRSQNLQEIRLTEAYRNILNHRKGGIDQLLRTERGSIIVSRKTLTKCIVVPAKTLHLPRLVGNHEECYGTLLQTSDGFMSWMDNNNFENTIKSLTDSHALGNAIRLTSIHLGDAFKWQMAYQRLMTNDIERRADNLGNAITSDGLQTGGCRRTACKQKLKECQTSSAKIMNNMCMVILDEQEQKCLCSQSMPGMAGKILQYFLTSKKRPHDSLA